MADDTGQLDGRVALVTGASGGIGRAVAGRLLAAGATVVATGRNLDTLQADSDRFHPLQADMAALDTLAPLVARVQDEHGRLDILLPNAGVADVRTLPETSLADWQRSLDVNLTAPFLLAQAAAEGMCRRRWGRILFTSSVAAFTGGFVGPQYAAAKAGLQGLVAFLSGRLVPFGVTTNAVAPALIGDTTMIAGLPEDAPTPPVGRMGSPDEVADLALAVLRNGYLSGQVLLLDGGMHPR